MSFKEKKRFIAGVVCPKCSEMDSTVAYQDEDTQYRECVSCGFQDTMSLNAPEELTTRVTPTGKSVLDDDEQPLKIMDPSKLH